jgi:hypothetical protein
MSGPSIESNRLQPNLGDLKLHQKTWRSAILIFVPLVFMACDSTTQPAQAPPGPTATPQNTQPTQVHYVGFSTKFSSEQFLSRWSSSLSSTSSDLTSTNDFKSAQLAVQEAITDVLTNLSITKCNPARKSDSGEYDIIDVVLKGGKTFPGMKCSLSTFPKSERIREIIFNAPQIDTDYLYFTIYVFNRMMDESKKVSSDQADVIAKKVSDDLASGNINTTINTNKCSYKILTINSYHLVAIEFPG